MIARWLWEPLRDHAVDAIGAVGARIVEAFVSPARQLSIENRLLRRQLELASEENRRLRAVIARSAVRSDEAIRNQAAAIVRSHAARRAAS